VSRDLWALIALIAFVVLSYLPIGTFVLSTIGRLARIVGGGA